MHDTWTIAIRGDTVSTAMRQLALEIAAVLLLAACAGESPAPPAPSESQATVAEASQSPLSYPERIDLVIECVRSYGVEASSYSGFGIRIEATEDAGLAYGEYIQGECFRRVDGRFPPPPPLSFEEQYFYMLDVADCLRDLGYTIREAPSLETYVEQLSSTDPDSEYWDPYFILSQQGVDTWTLQRESCPPAPWAR